MPLGIESEIAIAVQGAWPHHAHGLALPVDGHLSAVTGPAMAAWRNAGWALRWAGPAELEPLKREGWELATFRHEGDTCYLADLDRRLVLLRRAPRASDDPAGAAF